MTPEELKTLSALLRKLYDSDEIADTNHRYDGGAAIGLLIDQVIPEIMVNLDREFSGKSYDDEHRQGMEIV